MNTPVWNIGGGIKHSKNLIDNFINQKQYLDTTHKYFNYVYDSIFGLKWNGGRVCSPKDSIPLTSLISLIKQYNDLGVGFNWSFTNLLLTKEDINDEYCNLLLEATNDSLNGVILTSSILKEHIKKNYPKLRIIYSVCNGLKSIDEYKKALDENDLVVLHPDFNHNHSFLEQLPDKKRIEVMVNDICSFGCPYRYEHYKQLSEYILHQSTNPIIHFPEELDMSSDLKRGCKAIRVGYSKDERNRLTFYDIDMLQEMGFHHFKIIGREHEWKDYNQELNKYLNQYFLRNCIKEVKLNHHI